MEAGRKLGEALRQRAEEPDLLVLGLPRGGVPVALEVARALRAPLDVCVVRKLGVPWHRELAMGAIASGGVRVLNTDLLAELGIGPEAVAAVAAEEGAELARREAAYRGGRPPLGLRGRRLVVVDDGAATGATLLAAVKALRQGGPAHLQVAVPVGSPEAVAALRACADAVVCLLTPRDLRAIGCWYDDFAPTSDAEVRACLAEAEGWAEATSP